MSILPEGKLNNNLLKKLFSDIKNSSPKKPKIGEDSTEILIKDHKKILVSSDPITFETDDIGGNLIDICSNDIYASGGIPKWLLVTCLIPLNTSFEELRNRLSSLSNKANINGIDIVGGHTEVTSSVNKFIISGTIIGVYNKNFNENEKIKPNQDIIIGGLVGIEGSKIICSNIQKDEFLFKELETKCKDLSISVKKISESVLKSGGVIRMHDPTEGGIATAINEITEYGNVGSQIVFEKIKFVENFEKACEKLKINPLGVISSGCLIIISNSDNSNKIISDLNQNNIPSSIIGKTTKKEKGNIIINNGKPIKLGRFDQDEIIKIL